MNDCIAISSKFIPASNTRGSRIKLTPHTPCRDGLKPRTIGYNYEFNSSTEQAENWLKLKGLYPLAEASLNDGSSVFLLPVAQFTQIKKTFSNSNG